MTPPSTIIRRNDTMEYLLTDGCDAYYWGTNLEQAALVYDDEDANYLMKALGYKDIPYSVVEDCNPSISRDRQTHR